MTVVVGLEVVVVVVDVVGASVVLLLPPPKNFLIPLKKPDFFVVTSISESGSSAPSFLDIKVLII